MDGMRDAEKQPSWVFLFAPPSYSSRSSCPIFLWSIDTTLALELQALRTEVQEQTGFDLRSHEVVYELNFVRLVERLNRLVLDKNAVLNHHVGEEVADQCTVISDLDSLFAVHLQARLAQLMSKSVSIHRFQKART